MVRILTAALLIAYLLAFDFTRGHHLHLEPLLEEHFHSHSDAFHHHHDGLIAKGGGSGISLLHPQGGDNEPPGHIHATAAEPGSYSISLEHRLRSHDRCRILYGFIRSTALPGSWSPRAPPAG